MNSSRFRTKAYPSSSFSNRHPLGSTEHPSNIFYLFVTFLSRSQRKDSRLLAASPSLFRVPKAGLEPAPSCEDWILRAANRHLRCVGHGWRTRWKPRHRKEIQDAPSVGLAWRFYCLWMSHSASDLCQILPLIARFGATRSPTRMHGSHLPCHEAYWPQLFWEAHRTAPSVVNQ